MKQLYENVAGACSRNIAHTYSTSFSIGIRTLHKSIRQPVYAIYGFVRLADEIVDTFHDHDKARLMRMFREDTVRAIEMRISMNPVLHSFQEAYHKYAMDWELVDQFLKSMEMDLTLGNHDRVSYDNYILGSAEVVGLMCLKVFTAQQPLLYEELKPFAMKLGAAFQKVNFLRDVKDDYEEKGRTYFPELEWSNFSESIKQRIEDEIQEDFDAARKGIRRLPSEARFGVYVAFIYYQRLFQKIKTVPAAHIMNTRVRISNTRKLALFMRSYYEHNLNLI
ncbi:MAG: phytoene/squalene synthase family protein [Flavobacteriales bacterium]|nr:phytoene/squalene synthase family protein [Flavobacteriales bacterium]